MLKDSGVVIHSCNHSTQEDETGGSQIRSQPGPHHKTLPQRKRVERGFGLLIQLFCITDKGTKA
jgi:hypothetical protein